MAIELWRMYGSVMIDNKDAIKKLNESDKKARESSQAFKKMGDTIKKMGKVAIAGTVAAAAGVAALTKAAISEGAELEQSIGGIETLYKDNADIMIKYANGAFKTTGQSANEYMSTVTGFSASLIQSLGGDTKEAARIGHMAMVDMADNANKMGTSQEAIQNAYGGFAKSNYTMLDNLSLGYGGTKTEMERLLKDAQKFSGVEYKIENLNDVYEAIHVVQEEMGITGTTALEAEKTISGSLSSMKSAFKNILGKLALGEDIGPSLNDLGNTIKIFFVDNLLPMVGRILKALPTAIKPFIKAIIPGLVALGKDLLSGFGDGAVEGFTSLVNAIEETTDLIINTLVKSFQFVKRNADILIPVLSGVVGAFVAFKIITTISKGIQKMQALMTALKASTIAQTFAQGGLNAVMAANPMAMIVIGIGLLVAAGIALWRNWDVVKAKAEELWKKMKEVGTKVKENFNDMKKKVIEFVTTMVRDSIKKVIDLKDGAIQKIKDMKDNVVNGVKNMKNDVIAWFSNMKKDAIQRAYDMIDYVKSMPGKMAQGIRNGAGKVKSSFLSMWNNVVSAIKKPVNAVLGGANWILGKFNAPKIALWNPEEYAKGTDGHMGGPALVNDQKGGTYREAIQTPDGEIFIPKGRNVLFPNMPKGTKVMPAGETKRVFAYKKGVGIWDSIKSVGSKAWDGLKKGAGAIWDFASKPGELIANVIKDRVSFKGFGGAALDMAQGLVGTVKDKMVNWVKDLFSSNDNPDNIGGLGSTLMGGLGFKGFRKTSPFGYRTHPTLGYRKLHTGVDLAAATGTNVFAQHAGKVLSSGWAGSYGKMVKIGQGIMEQIYAHLSQNIARTGSSVKKGQLIGKVGSTGRSTGPHLHYEVRKGGRPIHPGYENGGWIDRDHLARIGEGNKLEAVIPMTKPGIAKPMIEQASNMLGINNDKMIIELLEEMLEYLRLGHVINIDGRNVFNAMSPHMAMAVKGRR